MVIQFKATDYIFRLSSALYVYEQFTREAVQTPSSEAKGYLGVIAHRVDSSIGEIVFQIISQPKRIPVTSHIRLAVFATKFASEFIRPSILRFAFMGRVRSICPCLLPISVQSVEGKYVELRVQGSSFGRCDRLGFGAGSWIELQEAEPLVLRGLRRHLAAMKMGLEGGLRRRILFSVSLRCPIPRSVT